MPALFLFIPLAGIFLLNIPGRKAGGKMAAWVAGTVCAIQMVLAATFGWSAWQDAAQTLKLPFGTSLSIDIVSVVVLFTIGMVGLMAVIAGGRGKLNFANMLLVSVMGMSGVAMVRDFFSLYIFLEITGVGSYVMIAMRKDSDGLEGSFKYLLMSAVATVLMLSALALLYMKVGTLQFTGSQSVASFLATTADSHTLAVKAALILLVSGFCIKAGVVPFHGWVPGAYTSAPPEVSVLLAGVITKAGGVYAILRVMNDVFKGLGLGLPFMVLGAVSIVVGALAAIGQKDMKRMLAWSSISQVGYIVLGAGAMGLSSGINANMAMAGSLLHFFNHATFKSLLFVNAAAVEEQAGTREMEKLGGLAQNMKITGGTSVVGFLSTAGVPPLSGFWSKLLIIVALWGAGQYAFAAIALGASILTLGYFLIMQRKVFFGKIREELAGIREAGAKYTVPALILAAVTVLVGVFFPFVLQYMHTLGMF